VAKRRAAGLTDTQIISANVTDVAPVITGDDGNNTLTGTSENDTILGLGGTDTVVYRSRAEPAPSGAPSKQR
jgi:Ca2+-binding RTX toxin-like protein